MIEVDTIRAATTLQPPAVTNALNTLSNKQFITAFSNTAPASFADMVVSGLQNVNTQLNSSQVALQRIAVGDVQNLHQVMVGLEESRLSFQLFMQVRNRALEAYQDIMRMQV